MFFKKEEIERYSSLQKKIATSAAKYIKRGAYFLYITCSVFKKENEDVVEHVLSGSNLSLIEKQYYKGYNMQADTLFAALFIAD